MILSSGIYPLLAVLGLTAYVYLWMMLFILTNDFINSDIFRAFVFNYNIFCPKHTLSRIMSSSVVARFVDQLLVFWR